MAVYPIAGGTTDLSSTGTIQYTPQIWSLKTIVKFYKSTVFGEITNNDYEGEIKNMGDTVIIRTVPDITVQDYTIGQNLTYDQPGSDSTTLTIDKGHWFGHAIDDVQKYQSDISYAEKFSDDASMQMKIKVDNKVLNNVDSTIPAANQGDNAGAISGAYTLGKTGTAIALTKTNVVDYIVDCGTVLDEQNIPEMDRWMVMPAPMANLIKKSDIKDASLTGDSVSPLRNGKIGSLDRFTLYITNNYDAISDTGNKWKVLFGHKSAITFASQIQKIETLRNPYGFGDFVRGLHIYGYKVIKPEALGMLYCSF